MEEAHGEAHVGGAGAVPSRDAGPQRDGGDGLPRQQARRHRLHPLAAAIVRQAPLELRRCEQGLPGQRQRRRAVLRWRRIGCIVAACAGRAGCCCYQGVEVMLLLCLCWRGPLAACGVRTEGRGTVDTPGDGSNVVAAARRLLCPTPQASLSPQPLSGARLRPYSVKAQPRSVPKSRGRQVAADGSRWGLAAPISQRRSLLWTSSHSARSNRRSSVKCKLPCWVVPARFVEAPAAFDKTYTAARDHLESAAARKGMALQAGA